MDNQTIQTYNQMAAAYDAETTDFWDKFPRDFFDSFAQSVNGTILDVGCGPGRDALLLQERGLNLTCLDASETMVKICQSKGLRAVVGDFLQLPFAPNSFNGVWAYTSLLHVPKAQVDTAFTEISRVLTPKGILGLGLIEGTTEEYKRSVKNTGVTLPRWFSYYTKTEVEALLNKHGFSLVSFTTFQPNTRVYLNFIAQKN